MIHCRSAREQMAFYLDDELHGSERVEFERHVRDCETCSHDLERERSFLSSVRSSGGYRAPSHLMTRIEQILDEESESVAASPAFRRRISRLLGGRHARGDRRRIAAIAACVAIV
jgi:hypothetical protein